MPAVINIIQGDIIMSFEFIRKLPTPTDIKRDFPVPERVAELKKERDKEIADVITGRSDKFLAIIGPCSADNEDAVLDYTLRLKKVQEKIADKYIKEIQVKTPSMEVPISQLSGGNQQKVILGRWLATNPDFLILDEPTRGIDIGTKTEIQKLIIKLAKEGKAVIFISSEIEEMLRTCDRMVVLRDGVKVGEIDDEMTQNSIMKAIAGGDKDE